MRVLVSCKISFFSKELVCLSNCIILQVSSKCFNENHTILVLLLTLKFFFFQFTIVHCSLVTFVKNVYEIWEQQLCGVWFSFLVHSVHRTQDYKLDVLVLAVKLLKIVRLLFLLFGSQKSQRCFLYKLCQQWDSNYFVLERNTMPYFIGDSIHVIIFFAKC